VSAPRTVQKSDLFRLGFITAPDLSPERGLVSDTSALEVSS
jgi:hypothetical protein